MIFLIAKYLFFISFLIISIYFSKKKNFFLNLHHLSSHKNFVENSKNTPVLLGLFFLLGLILFNYINNINLLFLCIVIFILGFFLDLGINITGINAEVAIGQWEFQVFAEGKKQACDDLWMARYILAKLGENYGYTIEYHPKPLLNGDWNGSGLHTNFSNKHMREEGDEQYYMDVFTQFESAVLNHMDKYGSDNQLRLTGKHETQSIDKFSWGISDRGASLRISPQTAKTWKGYIEDRRPASNGNPYLIIKEILTSIWVVDKGWVQRNETY